MMMAGWIIAFTTATGALAFQSSSGTSTVETLSMVYPNEEACLRALEQKRLVDDGARCVPVHAAFGNGTAN